MQTEIFSGVLPALMTPCRADRSVDFEALARSGCELMEAGMTGAVYCGSMGDWPLLTDADRMKGVEALVEAGVPVVAGTGAINTGSAVAHAAHAARAGAKGLMVIPRVLSRGPSLAAQEEHFKAILSAAPDVPAIIYNSPYYGFATRADLFFRLREAHPNLVGFKEFGGPADLRYAAETITSRGDGVSLVIGVDTAVFHGFVHCGASGVITGIGNVLPKEVLHLTDLSRRAARGDATARRLARELDDALAVLASFDEGPDLVLYFKHLMTLKGRRGYEHHFNPADALSLSQRGYAEAQLTLFDRWYADWSPAAASALGGA